ncbi:MAG: hypothetical protein Q8O42_09425 [Acidobacteriota bacterium]|nr:hypothetical protein [Acidobacteriota bacterium]
MLAAIDPIVGKMNVFEEELKSAPKVKTERVALTDVDPFEPEREIEMVLFPPAASPAQIKKLGTLIDGVGKFRDSVQDQRGAHELLTRSWSLMTEARLRLSSRIALDGSATLDATSSPIDQYAAELLLELADTFCRLDLPLVSTPSGAYCQTAMALLGVEAIAHKRVADAIKSAKARDALAADARRRRLTS